MPGTHGTSTSDDRHTARRAPLRCRCRKRATVPHLASSQDHPRTGRAHHHGVRREPPARGREPGDDLRPWPDPHPLCSEPASATVHALDLLPSWTSAPPDADADATEYRRPVMAARQCQRRVAYTDLTGRRFSSAAAEEDLPGAGRSSRIREDPGVEKVRSRREVPWIDHGDISPEVITNPMSPQK